MIRIDQLKLALDQEEGDLLAAAVPMAWPPMAQVPMTRELAMPSLEAPMHRPPAYRLVFPFTR